MFDAPLVKKSCAPNLFNKDPARSISSSDSMDDGSNADSRVEALTRVWSKWPLPFMLAWSWPKVKVENGE